jgi:hypothetical protein
MRGTVRRRLRLHRGQARIEFGDSSLRIHARPGDYLAIGLVDRVDTVQRAETKRRGFVVARVLWTRGQLAA